MRRSEKPFVVQDLAARIKDAKSVVVLDYQGVPVSQLEKLRLAIREVGGRLVVAKNTLLKLALKAAKMENARLPDGQGKWKMEDYLVGPTAVVFAEKDEMTPLQILGKLLTEPKFKFGIFGPDFFDAEKLLRLSRLPTRAVLLNQLAGLVTAPKYGLVGTLQVNLARLVFILNTRAKGGE